MNIVISNTHYLAAAALFQAVGDVRYFLNGVYIAPAEKGADIVATNGHALIHIHDKNAHGVTEPVILSGLKFAALKKKSYGDAPCTLSADETNSAAVLKTIEGTLFALGIVDGTFPDWERVINDCDDSPPPRVDPRYLKSVALAAELFPGNYVDLSASETQLQAVFSNAPVRCVVMEVRK